MAQIVAERRDIDFVLYEQFNIENSILKEEKSAEFNKKTVDMIVSEARNLVKEMLPVLKTADEEGCKFDT